MNKHYRQSFLGHPNPPNDSANHGATSTSLPLAATAEPRRVPRPLGLTHKAIMASHEEVLVTVINHYLNGNFPIPGKTLTTQRFLSLYKIPTSLFNQVLRDKVSINPTAMVEQGNNVLSKMLSIISEPQAKAQRLTSYLEGEVYETGKRPGHLLVQNLIGSLNLERQGAESIAKMLGTMLTSDYVREAAEEAYISVEEAISLISESNLQSLPKEPGTYRDTGKKDLSQLEEEIKKDPNIPNVQANIATEESHKKLPKVNSDYLKHKDLLRVKGTKPPSILPA